MNDLTARVAASMATRRDTAMTAVVVLTSFHHDGYDMRRIFVLPTSWAGWGLFIAFVALVLAGIWPVIGWVNRAGKKGSTNSQKQYLLAEVAKPMKNCAHNVMEPEVSVARQHSQYSMTKGDILLALIGLRRR